MYRSWSLNENKWTEYAKELMKATPLINAQR